MRRWIGRKNKRFDWNEKTHSLQVYQELEAQDATDLVLHGPVDHTAAGIGRYAEDQLRDLGVPEHLVASVQTISDVGVLEKYEPYLPQEVFERLFQLLDGDPIEGILEEGPGGAGHG